MRFPWPLLVLGVLLVACGGGGDSKPTATAAVANTPQPGSTVTAQPSTSPAGVTEDAYGIEQVIPRADFERMLLLAAIPGDEQYAAVVTQGGVIYRVSLGDNDEDPTVFLDVSEQLIANPGNEEGLLGLAFAPDYANTGRLYVYYTAGNPRRSVLSRFISKGDAADPSSEQVIMEVPQPFANHNGGHLLFGPDGMLYIGLGDGGSSGDPRGNGQDTQTLLGSILRIDVSGDTYTSPADNPFAQGGGAPEIWAYGLRNPWRFTFDRKTGDMWAGDVGQNAWEEVERVTSGGNYGWNIMEGAECFQAASCNREGLILPRAVYGREGGCSVTGGFVYRGAAMPELRGWYVYGDYCSGKVWALDTRDETSPAVLIAQTDKSISSFAEEADGELLLISFDRAIYRLVRE